VRTGLSVGVARATDCVFTRRTGAAHFFCAICSIVAQGVISIRPVHLQGRNERWCGFPEKMLPPFEPYLKGLSGGVFAKKRLVSDMETAKRRTVAGIAGAS
jgi:hypothetical protein